MKTTALIGKLALAAALAGWASPAQAANCPVTIDDSDGNGSPDAIELRGDSGLQKLVVEIRQGVTELRFDCDGNNSYTNPLAGDRVITTENFLSISMFMVDDVTINIVGTLSGVSKNLLVRAAKNLTIGGSGALTANSSLVINVRNSVSLDYITLDLPPLIDASSLLFRAEAGDNNDRVSLIADGVISNGSVVDAKLSGNSHANILTFKHSGTLSGSRLNVDAEGGPGLDFINVSLAGTITNGGRLQYRGDGSGLNDKFDVRIGALVVDAGSEAWLDLYGDVGTDVIAVSRGPAPVPPVAIAGLLALNLNGGLSGDQLTLDLRGAGLVLQGALRARLDGFEGGDVIRAFADVDGTPASVVDLSIHGGLGVDKITTTINSTANQPANYGPAGRILVDGGYSTGDVCTTTSTSPALERNCEL